MKTNTATTPTAKSVRGGYQKGEQRVQAILNAAENILIDSGYHNLSMRKVAGKAGISVGNLQYYFPSKEDLIEALLNNVIQDYLNIFDEIRHHGTPKEQFTHMIEQIVKDLNTKRTTIFFPELWSLANHEKNINKFMDAMYGKYRGVLASVICEINPALSKQQAKRLSIFISSSLEGHTVFIGYQKPWLRETKHIVNMAVQSFLWLIEHGEIPD